jgi:hypothetical protein
VSFPNCSLVTDNEQTKEAAKESERTKEATEENERTKDEGGAIIHYNTSLPS